MSFVCPKCEQTTTRNAQTATKGFSSGKDRDHGRTSTCAKIRLHEEMNICWRAPRSHVWRISRDYAHGILLYMENNYFYFSMHSSSLYSIFANWLCKCPRLHEYYTSSVWCHTTSRLEPVSLTLRTSPRLRQIKLNDSSSHEWFPTCGHMHFTRMSQYTRNQSSRCDLIRSDAVGEIHGAWLVRTKQRSLHPVKLYSNVMPYTASKYHTFGSLKTLYV